MLNGIKDLLKPVKDGLMTFMTFMTFINNSLQAIRGDAPNVLKVDKCVKCHQRPVKTSRHICHKTVINVIKLRISQPG